MRVNTSGLTLLSPKASSQAIRTCFSHATIIHAVSTAIRRCSSCVIGLVRSPAPVLLIVVFGLCCHGLILLTDYVIWDGWWYSHFIRNRSETPYLTRILREIGRPQDIMFFLPFFFTNDVAALSKILGVAWWIIAAVSQYGFFRTALPLPRAVSLAIVLCSVAAPFFPFCGELTYNMYVTAVALFWLAWYLVGLRVSGRDSGFLARALTVALFALSFELNSHIAHLYAVGLFVVMYRFVFAERNELKRRLLCLVRGYWELALLPVAYWVWKNTFTPTCGYYETYNSLRADPLIILGHYGAFLSHFPIHLSRLIYRSGQVGAAAAIVTAGSVLVYRARAEAYARILTTVRPAKLLLVGMFLFGCSIFSYCAVDQPVLCDGWAARNTILVNVPFAVMLVGACGVLGRAVPKCRALVVLLPISVFMVSGFVACNQATIRWQAFGAKQLSIRAGIRSLLSIKDSKDSITQINVVHLRDYFVLADTLPWYPPIVWTYMVAPDNAEPNVFVIDTRLWVPDEVRVGADGQQYTAPPALQVSSANLEELMKQTTQPYALTRIPLSGQTLNIAVLPGDLGVDDLAIGLEYLERRLFNPATLPEFVASLSKLITYE
jgi:hypothetical protein